MSKIKSAERPQAARQCASGGTAPDSCWSCKHYANHGGNSGGTPPWPTCAFRLRYPDCERWSLSDHPWRFDWNWRDRAEAAGASTKQERAA